MLHSLYLGHSVSPDSGRSLGRGWRRRHGWQGHCLRDWRLDRRGGGCHRYYRHAGGIRNLRYGSLYPCHNGSCHCRRGRSSYNWLRGQRWRRDGNYWFGSSCNPGCDRNIRGGDSLGSRSGNRYAFFGNFFGRRRQQKWHGAIKIVGRKSGGRVILICSRRVVLDDCDRLIGNRRGGHWSGYSWWNGRGCILGSRLGELCGCFCIGRAGQIRCRIFQHQIITCALNSSFVGYNSGFGGSVRHSLIGRIGAGGGSSGRFTAFRQN